ncbi:MAG: Tim44 domain-containing protein [Rickettsiales bacterium]|nr:Tim44 domain-containing protein [Rickettsiales bacterium]
MDIIFFAAVSIFIFFKLRAELGKISDEEKTKITEKIKADREKIIAIQKQISGVVEKAIEQSIEQQNQSNEKVLGNLSEPLRQTLLQIFQRCNITAEFFINGTKSCFEMIIKAFADKDLTTLKFLLSEKIYAGFESAISKRNAEEKNLCSNLIAIEKAEILEAIIVNNQALITVKITSRQINYFTNKTGEIIEGKKDEIQEMYDIWTFKKDLDSINPNWIVSTTR